MNPNFEPVGSVILKDGTKHRVLGHFVSIHSPGAIAPRLFWANVKHGFYIHRDLRLRLPLPDNAHLIPLTEPLYG